MKIKQNREGQRTEMSSNLDMSLEDIIKINKKSGGGGGGDKRGGANSSSRVRPARNLGPGPNRRLPNRSANRPAPYSSGFEQAPETVWKHDVYNEDAAVYPAARGGSGGRVSAIETGTKLLISNLDYGVSDDDIKELFSEAGDLKRYSIHYDRSGRSKGTAEVVFSRRRDAEVALKKYHNVQLDGKPMKIEIVGTNIATRTAAAPPAFGGFNDQNGAPRSQGRGGALGRLRNGGGRGGCGFHGYGRNPGGGGGRGGRGGRSEKNIVSAEDLDADLEKYHSQAMETN